MIATISVWVVAACLVAIGGLGVINTFAGQLAFAANGLDPVSSWRYIPALALIVIGIAMPFLG